MTANDVRACLSVRWPDSEYLSIEEAPEDSSRQGRKLDLLVFGLWKSRGLQRDGVEIKVSLSDWKRELLNAAKADWWWRHVHRFWVAVPAKLAEQVRQDLPDTWGLLACSLDKPTKVVVKAPFHQPEDLPWSTVMGLLRASADCGIAALQRAEGRGFDRGVARQKEVVERQTGDRWVREELEKLRERIHAFEQAAGISFSRGWPDAAEVGRLVALIQKERADPGYAADFLGSQAGLVAGNAEYLAERAKELRKMTETLTAVVANGETA